MIANELDKAGIPVAIITAFKSIAFNVGGNRIINGGKFTSPAGNPDLPPEREKSFRRQLVDLALKAIQEPIEAQKIYNVEEA